MTPWEKIQLTLKRYVIRSVLKRPGPRNEVEANSNDYGRNFGYARVGDLEGQFINAMTITPDGLKGYYPTRGRDVSDLINVSNLQILESEITISYRYRDLMILASWNKWIWYYFFGGYRGLWLWTCVRQWWIGRQNLIREDRLKVLENLYENEIVQGKGSTDPVQYFINRRGLAWMGHPNVDQLMRHYNLIFRSLKDAGDLQLDASSRHYILTPQALTTLARNASESRRHRDAVIMQVIIAGLTFGLLILGVPAAIEAFQSLGGQQTPPEIFPA